MKEQRKEILKNFAKSKHWEVIKEEIFQPLLDDIRDVSNPVNLGDEKIDPQDAFYAKKIAAQKLKILKQSIDKLSKKDQSNIDRNDFI